MILWTSPGKEGQIQHSKPDTAPTTMPVTVPITVPVTVPVTVPITVPVTVPRLLKQCRGYCCRLKRNNTRLEHLLDPIICLVIREHKTTPDRSI